MAARRRGGGAVTAEAGEKKRKRGKEGGDTVYIVGRRPSIRSSVGWRRWRSVLLHLLEAATTTSLPPFFLLFSRFHREKREGKQCEPEKRREGGREAAAGDNDITFLHNQTKGEKKRNTSGQEKRDRISQEPEPQPAARCKRQSLKNL